MIRNQIFIIYNIYCPFFISHNKILFSDQHIKNSYRSINNIEKKLNSFSKNLPILKSDTVNIIKFLIKSNLKKKKYNFWKLLDQND